MYAIFEKKIIILIIIKANHKFFNKHYYLFI